MTFTYVTTAQCLVDYVRTDNDSNDNYVLCFTILIIIKIVRERIQEQDQEQESIQISIINPPININGFVFASCSNDYTPQRATAKQD